MCFSIFLEKTEFPPEWILIPSVLPLSTTVKQAAPSSTMKPTTSTETTRFPTRKPTASTSTTNSPITKKPLTRPTTEMPIIRPVTKQPQPAATIATEKSPVTMMMMMNMPAQTTITIDDTTMHDEEISLTTESVTMFEEEEYESEKATTTYDDDVSETENIINHATSALPSYTQTSTGTIMSEFNSTVPIFFTETSITSSSTHSSIGMHSDFVFCRCYCCCCHSHSISTQCNELNSKEIAYMENSHFVCISMKEHLFKSL